VDELFGVLLRFCRMILGPSIKISVEPERSVTVRFENNEPAPGKRRGILLENNGRGDAEWCSPQVIAVWHDGQLIDGETSKLQWSSTTRSDIFAPKRFPSGARFPIQVFGTDERTRTLQIKSEKEKSSSGHRFTTSGRYAVDIRIQVDVWMRCKYVRLYSDFDPETPSIEIGPLEITRKRPKAMDRLVPNPSGYPMDS